MNPTATERSEAAAGYRARWASFRENYMKTTVVLLAVILALALGRASQAQDEKLRCSVLSADSQGRTQFRDEYLPWQPGASPQSLVTPFLDAAQIVFLRLRLGYRSDWHPAPRKQFVMVLEGAMEVEAGDGNRREFRAGSVLLVTDTQGRGHRTNVLGEREVVLVRVAVP